MPRDDKADLLGAFLDSLDSITRAQKIKLCTMALAGLATCFGAGCWLTAKIYEHKLASTEVRHEQAILELQRKIGQGTTPQLSISVSHPDEYNVPKLSEAPASDISMAEFAIRLPLFNAEYAEKTSRLTSLQQPKYFDPYANKSYQWTGYISNVYVEGGKDGTDYCVGMRLDPKQKDGFTATCVFEGYLHDEMMKNLTKDQKITVRGVRAESGRLLHCVLVGSEAAPQTASAR
jgi:hypothetical protein